MRCLRTKSAWTPQTPVFLCGFLLYDWYNSISFFIPQLVADYRLSNVKNQLEFTNNWSLIKLGVWGGGGLCKYSTKNIRAQILQAKKIMQVKKIRAELPKTITKKYLFQVIRPKRSQSEDNLLYLFN